MAPKTPEGAIKSEIVAYLDTLGAVVEPLYTGMSRGGSGKYYSTPTRSLGRPDIFMLLNSIPVAIEVKAGTKQRKSQAEWMLRWISNGGVYWLVKSVADIKKNYEELVRSYG